jgi:hypothetical protein
VVDCAGGDLGRATGSANGRSMIRSPQATAPTASISAWAGAFLIRKPETPVATAGRNMVGVPRPATTPASSLYYSHPASVAIRTASIRLRPPSFVTADAR